MDDVPAMEVFYGTARLDNEPTNFGHCKEFSLLDRIRERPVLAYLKNDIGIQLV